MNIQCYFCHIPVGTEHDYVAKNLGGRTFEHMPICAHCWDKACELLTMKEK